MKQSIHFVTEIYLTPLSFMFSKTNAFFYLSPVPLPFSNCQLVLVLCIYECFCFVFPICLAFYLTIIRKALFWHLINPVGKNRLEHLHDFALHSVVLGPAAVVSQSAGSQARCRPAGLESECMTRSSGDSCAQ